MELRKRRNTLVAAALTAALAISSTAGAVAAQDEEDADLVTLTGTIVVVVDEDGATEYYLEVDGELVRLDVGPPWFWGEAHPLDGLDGEVVSVEGRVDEEMADEETSEVDEEQPATEPSLDVVSVDGEPLWTTETPPWAGGPKVVGESHPGHKGWSWGQAHRQADDEDDPEGDVMTGGPKVVGESHPGYDGWSKSQAAREEARGKDGERGKANAEQVKEKKAESKARGPKSPKGQAAREAAHARAEQARGGRGNEKKEGRGRP